MVLYILTPVSQGSYSNWGLGAGGSKPAAVDTPDDDDASWVGITDENLGDSYIVGDKPVLTAVTGVQGRLRGSIVVADPENPGGFNMRVGAAFDATIGLLYQNTFSEYPTYSNIQGTVGRPGAGAWTVADIDNPTLAVYFDKNTGSLDSGRMTTSYLVVDGTPPTGDFIEFLRRAAGEVASLNLCEMPALARRLARLTNIRLKPDELLAAWRAYRAYTFPRFCDLGGRA